MVIVGDEVDLDAAAFGISSQLEVGCVYDAWPTSQRVHWKRWDTGIQPVAVARDAIRCVDRSHEVQSDKSTVVTVLCDAVQAVVDTTIQLKHYKLKHQPRGVAGEWSRDMWGSLGNAQSRYVGAIYPQDRVAN